MTMKAICRIIFPNLYRNQKQIMTERQKITFEDPAAVLHSSPGRVVSLNELKRRTGLNETETAKAISEISDVINNPDGHMFYPQPEYPDIKTPVEPSAFLDELKKNRVGPMIIVPCSIFKPLTNYVQQKNIEFIWAQNEGPAMGIAAGTFTETGKPAAVFMQNSGLNNTANPLTSLNELYKTPVLMVISWRGEKPEAPEHNIMGAGLERFLKTLQLPYEVLTDDWKEQLRKMVEIAQNDQTPTAVVVRKGFFADIKLESKNDRLDEPPLSRLEAIKVIKEALPGAAFISSTGFPSRDSFAAKPTPDFYMLGSMGHTLPFAIGVVSEILQKGGDKKIVCFDGDGSALMHLGSIGLIEKHAPRGLLYVVLDNGVYESTGSQPLGNQEVDFVKVAEGLGVPYATRAEDELSIEDAVAKFRKDGKSTLLWVKVNTRGAEVGQRVSDTPPQILRKFQESI